VFLSSRTAELSHLGDNFKVMGLLVQAHAGLAILEEDHGRALLVSIPELGKLGIVLLLDGYNGAPVLEEGLGAEDIILDISLGVGVVEVDEDRSILRKLVEDLVHSIVLRGEGCSGGRAWSEGGTRCEGVDAEGANCNDSSEAGGDGGLHC